MKPKIILSASVLLFFSLLAGGSSDGDMNAFFTVAIVVFVAVVIIALIKMAVESHNKKKRLKMIEDDEKKSTDFDRSVSIGDDRCKLYFDATKKRVMIMQITTEEISKKYVDGFEFPGKNLARYTNGCYYVYEPATRRLLSGNYGSYSITNIGLLKDVSNDKSLKTTDQIAPSLNYLKTTFYKSSYSSETRDIYSLVDEHHGVIAVAEQGKIRYVFNYINVEKLPEKTGVASTISVKNAGNYMFVMDTFFKVLVIIGKDMHKCFSYSDIIEVSYMENGDQLFTKSTGRTVGGAIVGGVLMGGAGAVVGGLSGDSKQNKVVKNMDIKILLRSTEETSCVLHFMDSSEQLKTKEASDKSRYEEFLKNANKAKDLLSVIIDDAKQTAAQVAPVMSQPAAPQSSSVADELAKLASLKEQGILTDEEFKVQKEKLLNK